MTDLLERLQESLASRYRIDRELGAGGMAVVFLAEDLLYLFLCWVSVMGFLEFLFFRRLTDKHPLCLCLLPF